MDAVPVQEATVPGPRYALLELGLRCNLRCLHCASAAGVARPGELAIEEWRAVVRDLAALGCRSVDLMGGEALLSPRLHPVGEALAEAGIAWGLLTNGWLLDDRRAADLLARGCRGIGVSLDGATAATHDGLRGRAGAWTRALRALDRVATLPGLDGNRAILTSVNRRNLEELDALADLLEDRYPGFRWQLNLTTAEAKRLPADLRLGPDGVDRVAAFLHVRRRSGGRVHVTGSHDLCGLLADRDVHEFPWSGCPAGIANLGIQSDGKVKGCLSLDERFAVGNVRERPLRELWRDSTVWSFHRGFRVEALGPACADCVWGSRCRGGCLAYATATTGIPRHQPDCLWRRAPPERKVASPRATPAMPGKLRSACVELTLRCNLRCLHCGQAAGEARPTELALPEYIDLFADLRALGAERVVLLGGEPLLHPDWREIVAMAKGFGLRVSLVSNGLLLSATTATELATLGVETVGISLDGASDGVHDFLRGAPGAREKAWRAIYHLRAAGLPITIITTLSRPNLPELPALRDQLAAVGGLLWQLQSANGTGARFRAEWMPSPTDLLDVARFVEACRKALPPGVLAVATGHTLGHHALSVGPTGAKGEWRGCTGGVSTVGITSGGDVKGCLSMRADEIVGNIRATRLRDLWRNPDAFARHRRFPVGELQGGCARCPYGSECKAGCPEMARTGSGTVWDNPYCLRQADVASP